MIWADNMPDASLGAHEILPSCKNIRIVLRNNLQFITTSLSRSDEILLREFYYSQCFISNTSAFMPLPYAK